MTKDQPTLSFDMMAWMFKIRDLITPRSKVIEEIPLKKGMTVLDYGTGPGTYIEPTLERIGERGTYHAADINPRAGIYIERIKKRTEHGRLHFIQTDCKTGLKPSSVDFVYLHDIYHGLPEREKNLVELKRVLKKDGSMSFNDHHMTRERISEDGPLSKHFRIVKEGKRTFILKKK